MAGNAPDHPSHKKLQLLSRLLGSVGMNQMTLRSIGVVPGTGRPVNRPLACGAPSSLRKQVSGCRFASPRVAVGGGPAHTAKLARSSLWVVWHHAREQCFTERVMLAVLTLSGMGAVLWAFAEVWLRLQNWPAFEAWVARLRGV
jgi:hypothetical protein